MLYEVITPHLMLAQIYLLQKDHAKALAEAELAVLARPSCDGSYVAKANILNYLGRPAEAIELAKFAMRLTPVYPVYYPAVLAARITSYNVCYTKLLRPI